MNARITFRELAANRTFDKRRRACVFSVNSQVFIFCRFPLIPYMVLSYWGYFLPSDLTLYPIWYYIIDVINEHPITQITQNKE